MPLHLQFWGSCSWWSLRAARCSIGETPRGQQGTPAVTLPHRRDGLRGLWMAMWCPFRRPSLCRPVHRPCMRNALLEVTTIVHATSCHQRNDVEPYSRFKGSRMIEQDRNMLLGTENRAFAELYFSASITAS